MLRTVDETGKLDKPTSSGSMKNGIKKIKDTNRNESKTSLNSLRNPPKRKFRYYICNHKVNCYIYPISFFKVLNSIKFDPYKKGFVHCQAKY